MNFLIKLLSKVIEKINKKCCFLKIFLFSLILSAKLF